MTVAQPIHHFSHSSTNDKVLALVTEGEDFRHRRILDVGAGEGFFCQEMAALARARGVAPGEILRACDRFPEQFRVPDVSCDPIEEGGGLPYDADRFDTTVAIEVVEHVEDQFSFIRELYRVTRPGGRVFVTTPNLLNVNSRLRYLHSGFWLLFDPLPLSSVQIIHLEGHVHPVTYYYLAYIFHRAGFAAVRVHFDRRKRSGVALAAVLAPFIVLGNLLFRARLRGKAPERYAENRALLADTNGWDMLTSRSIIVEGIK
ncbi:MAG TPA: class I SAM-dependent methyltransferase [Gemmatimonadales bacterium]|nr:class I SAM-dependent methyltransferase [Gemmatimonadales bacterium]